MPIKRYGDPYGKPKVRPKGRVGPAFRKGAGYEYDIDSPDLPSRTRQGMRVSSRPYERGLTSHKQSREQRAKTAEIQKRHAAAQKRRIADRRRYRAIMEGDAFTKAQGLKRKKMKKKVKPSDRKPLKKIKKKNY